MLHLIPVLLPMAVGALLLWLRPRCSRSLSFLTALVTCLTLVFAGLWGSPLCLRFSRTVSLLLAPDGLSFFFLAIMGLGFCAVLLFAREYLGKEPEAPRFFGFTLLTMGAMLGLAMAGNILTFYMFYEMMSLLSFPLVLWSGEEKARRAAMIYLGFSVFGASLALMGILMAGEITLADFSAPLSQAPLSLRSLWAFLLMSLGFSCKAGMMPLANWLPTAHPVAPAPASALLSGIITKAGILGMIRTAFYLFRGAQLRGTFPQTVLLSLSILTIFCGSMLAYREKLLKKRLAYSSVSQLSYVIFGLMLLTPQGFSAGLLQVLFHACAKVGLFLCAGAFIHHCNANYVGELRGMGRRMPGVMGCFTCFSLSLIGIPPFGGFVSKWALASAALEQGEVLGPVGVIVLMVSALLTAGYLLPIVARGWFPGEEAVLKKAPAGPAMVVPLVVLALVAAVLGIFPKGLTDFFGSIAATLF